MNRIAAKRRPAGEFNEFSWSYLLPNEGFAGFCSDKDDVICQTKERKNYLINSRRIDTCYPVLMREKGIKESNRLDNEQYSIINKVKERKESLESGCKHCASRFVLRNQTQVALACSHRPNFPKLPAPFPNEGSLFTNLHESICKRNVGKENEYIFRMFIFTFFLILHACFSIFRNVFNLTSLGNGDVELARQLNQLAIHGNDAIPSPFQEYKRAGKSRRAQSSCHLPTIKVRSLDQLFTCSSLFSDLALSLVNVIIIMSILSFILSISPIP